MNKHLFTFEKAPENYSVLSAVGECATVRVCGTVKETAEDDTFLPLYFSYEHLFLYVNNEESGASACAPVHLALENGAFSCEISIPVGGPYAMGLCSYDEEKGCYERVHGACRRHFFVGDVYLIAGQSNAAGKAGGILHEGVELGVMLLRDLRTWDIASAPFSDYDDSRHNMFLHFAKILKKETGRPIGLIPAAMGGATLSRFVTEENGDLFQKMLSALKRQEISPKAVLWYQGCSDVAGVKSVEHYLERFAKFVQNVRKSLQNEHLPIYTFQLNRQILAEKDEKRDLGFDLIREAQRQAAKRISGVYVFPTIDGLSMSDFIHASRLSYVSFAERLALSVLANEYGKGLGVTVPEIRSATLEENELTLTFEGVSSYLYDFHCGTPRLPVTVTDAEGQISPLTHTVKKNEIKLILSRSAVSEAFVSLQSGSDPRSYIADFLTGIPALCFYCYPVSNKTGKGE